VTDALLIQGEGADGRDGLAPRGALTVRSADADLALRGSWLALDGLKRVPSCLSNFDSKRKNSSRSRVRWLRCLLAPVTHELELLLHLTLGPAFVAPLPGLPRACEGGDPLAPIASA
jgi:hypothetical protein